jgi:hypothetical protein
MSREIQVLPSADAATPRQVKLVTAGFVLWALFWAGLGAWVATDVAELERLTTEAAGVAGSLAALSRFLSAVSHVAFIGHVASSGASALRSAAFSLRSNAASSRRGLAQLSVLLGLAISAIPVLPFAVLLVRLHAERWRERTALKAALADPARRLVAIRYLARRATSNLPYNELCDRRLNRKEEAEALARAELERLGLQRFWQ